MSLVPFLPFSIVLENISSIINDVFQTLFQLGGGGGDKGHAMAVNRGQGEDTPPPPLEANQ